MSVHALAAYLPFGLGGILLAIAWWRCRERDGRAPAGRLRNTRSLR